MKISQYQKAGRRVNIRLTPSNNYSPTELRNDIINIIVPEELAPSSNESEEVIKTLNSIKQYLKDQS